MKRIVAAVAAIVIAVGTLVPAHAADTDENEFTVGDVSVQSDASISGNQTIDNWLSERGFEYDKFKAKLSVPEMTLTEADLKADYANLFGNFEGYGEDYSLTNNYTLDAMNSFKENFGSGLKSQYSEYTLSTDASEFLKQAQQTRDSIFASAKNSDSYKSALKSLSISSSVSSAKDVAATVQNGGKVDVSSVTAEINTLSSKLKNQTGVEDTVKSLTDAANKLKDSNSSKFSITKNKAEHYEDIVTDKLSADHDTKNFVYVEPEISNKNSIMYTGAQNAYNSMLDDLLASTKADSKSNSDSYWKEQMENIKLPSASEVRVKRNLLKQESNKNSAVSHDGKTNSREFFETFGNK